LNDKFFLGSFAGVTGAMVMVIFDFLLNLLPNINIKLIFGLSALFVPETLKGTLQGGFIAFIAHMICGAIIGFIILLLFDWTGYDRPLLKGGLMGVGFWFLTCGILARILNLNMQDKFIDNILNMLIHIPYGVTAGWIIYRYRPITAS